MKAIIKTTKGIDLADCPIPTVAAKNSVLVQIALAGLCRTDLYTAQNKIPVSMGRILGHEFSGIVSAMSADVTHVKIGSRIGIMPFINLNHNPVMLGIDVDGGYAEYALLHSDQVYAIPDNISLQVAAFLEPIAACLSVTNAPIKTYQSGLIVGNNRIAELTRRILYCQGFKQVEICCENDLVGVDGSSYDFVIETTPTEAVFKEIIRVVKDHGIILLKSRPFDSIPLPIANIVKKELKLFGVHYGSFQKAIDLTSQEAFEVKDLFGETYPLEEATSILSGTTTVSEDKKIFFRPLK